MRRAVVIEDLSVTYGAAAVLRGISLTAMAGEVVVILGASGSGKSTLLRTMLGLVPAPGRVQAARLEVAGPAGAVDLRGRSGSGWRAVRGDVVGAVFQDATLALSPLRRVGSLLVEASGRALDRDEQAERLRACGFADPGPVLDQHCWTLSGGMAQRVGMALATARRPPVVVADEPTTALDGLARAEIIARLRALAGAGAAVLVATHDVSVALAIADSVGVLDAGSLVEWGDARQVLTAPAHPASVRLVANSPWSLPVAGPRPVDRSARPAMAVQGMVKGFGRPVLRGVDLAVAPGEIVGVAGVSGAGKSTLVRCLVGLERPEAGRISAAGIDPEVQGWAAYRRGVQLVPQDPRAALNPWRVTAQAVADPLRYHRIGDRSARARRASALLGAVGLEDLGGRVPGELSTGQCQRVAIARALAVEPAVVVADEPVSALDTHTQAEVMALLRRIVTESGTAALVVSHDLHVLERLCDRVAVLDDGVIASDQLVGDLRLGAVHRSVAPLLACYPPDPFDRLRSLR